MTSICPSVLLCIKPVQWLPAVFLRFQTKDRVLRVSKSEIASENTFNGDHFEIKGKDKSSKL